MAIEDREEIKEYLDRVIKFWRVKREQKIDYAKYYVDAFQSARVSIFGEVLPDDDE